MDEKLNDHLAVSVRGSHIINSISRNSQNGIRATQTCKKENGYSRIVRGQQIVSSISEASIAKKRKRSPKSPFSDAFFDTVEPSMSTKMKSSAKVDSSLPSFDDAFLDDALLDKDEPKFDYDSNGEQVAAAGWTKQRIKGLETVTAGLIPGTNPSTRITLTKEMLSSAEVIAQVELKFIIIKTLCGVICAVDQHAADERVALEKLERALSNPDMHNESVIRMSKRSIPKRDLLKQISINPPKRLSLSQMDMATAKQYLSLLKKWKFSFAEADDGTLLALTGLPVVCDRVANVHDFMSFVKELSQFSGDVCPEFVKNIIKSNACRYAVMFGDELSRKIQIDLIDELSKCEMCFICAHGRPSVIPLFDMIQERSTFLCNTTSHSSAKEATTAQADREAKQRMLSMRERFGPKRVIRR
jgi:DNA mismatch repair ATPase MutL